MLSGFFEANRHRLPLLIPIAWGGGAAVYFALLSEPPVWPLGIGTLIAIAAAWRVRRQAIWFYLSLYALCALLGFINAGVQTMRMHAPVLVKSVFWKQVSGHVDEIALDECAIKVTLSRPSIDTVAAEQTPRKLRITFKKNPDPPLSVGDEIKIKATLFPLPKPVAPGAFDFGRYLYFQGLGAVGYTTQLPEVIQHAATATNALDQFRFDFANHIMARMQPPYGAVAAALTVGEQKTVPEEINEMLRDSGLYHILSISGLHMAIAAGLVFFTLRFLLALWPYAALHWPIKKIAASLALISSFLYLLAAGSPVPAIRSFIMVGVVFVAILCDRKGISMVSLAWAALLILIVQPDAIVSASFQLSFAATAAIIALYEHYGSALYHPHSGIIRHLLTVVFATVVVSLVATLATAPFVITHFNRLQLWGMLANAAVSPLTAFVIMPAVVLSFLLFPFGLEQLAFFPLEWGIRIMLNIGTLVAGLPHASIYLPSFTTTGFVAAFLGLYIFLLLKTRARLTGILLIGLGFASMLLIKQPHILIADSGKLIAVADASNRLVMLKGGNDSFTSEQWAKSRGQEATLLFKDAVWDEKTTASCDKEACTYTHDSTITLFIFNARATERLCESAKPDIVIIRYRLYEGECTEVKQVLDK